MTKDYIKDKSGLKYKLVEDCEERIKIFQGKNIKTAYEMNYPTASGWGIWCQLETPVKNQTV